jgi:hypothetical protein
MDTVLSGSYIHVKQVTIGVLSSNNQKRLTNYEIPTAGYDKQNINGIHSTTCLQYHTTRLSLYT